MTLQDAQERQNQAWQLFVAFLKDRTPLQVCCDICSEAIRGPLCHVLWVVESHHTQLLDLGVGPALCICRVAIHNHGGQLASVRSLLAREAEVRDLEQDLDLIECKVRIDAHAFALKYEAGDLDFQQGFPGPWT
jgi:hypothetical protein